MLVGFDSRLCGQVAVWDHQKVQERTVWRLNHVMTNNLAFLPGGDGMSCCSSSSDGTLKVRLVPKSNPKISIKAAHLGLPAESRLKSLHSWFDKYQDQ